MSNRYTVSYYPWITQGVDANLIREAVGVFAQALADRINGALGPGNVVTVTMAADIGPLISQVTTQPRCVALLNPLGYVFARRLAPAVQVAAVALRPGLDGKPGPTYRAQIYTAKKSAIRSIADAKGRSIGFGVPFSTSNFLVPASMLKREHRLFSASSVSFLGGHIIVAKAVYDGIVDVGAGHDGVITGLARVPGYGDAEERLLRLAWSDPIPSDPVVINIADDQERAAVTEAILRAGADPEVVAQGVAIFWGGSTGLASVAPSAYDSIDSVLQTLALEQQDLLG